MLVARTYEKARRSTRIRLHLPVRVSSADPKVPFCEHCYTLIVNVQGCGVRLPFPVERGVPVVVDELPTGVTVSAKVANCVELVGEGKYWLVGLAFAQPSNVWGIKPAPPDWDEITGAAPTQAGALHSTTNAHSGTPATSSGKRPAWPYSMFSEKGEAHPGRK